MTGIDQKKISADCRDSFDLKDYHSELLAEYTALRAEVIQRMTTRHQLLTFSIVVLSAIIAFNAPPSTLFAYPILGVFLALGWAHNDFRIAEIGEYVRVNIETKLPGLNWETNFFSKDSQGTSFWYLLRATILSASGIIVGSQLLAFIIPFLNNPPPAVWVIVVDVGAMLLTLYILYSRKRYTRKSRMAQLLGIE